MPIDLHPKCAARLVELTEQALGSCVVENNSFLEISDAGYSFLVQADQAIPPQTFEDPALSGLGSFPFLGFVHRELTRNLTETRDYGQDAETFPLHKLAEYSDTSAAAKDLVAEFCKLPRRYRISFPILGAAAEDLRSLEDGSFSLHPKPGSSRTKDWWRTTRLKVESRGGTGSWTSSRMRNIEAGSSRRFMARNGLGPKLISRSTFKGI